MQLARACKAILELDRARASREKGYNVALLKLLDPGLTAKYHVLVGLPGNTQANDGQLSKAFLQ